MFLACRVVSARVFTKQPQLGESVWKLDSLGQCRDWIAATSDMAGESVARPVRQTSMARVFHAKPEQCFSESLAIMKNCEKSLIIADVPAG